MNSFNSSRILARDALPALMCGPSAHPLAFSSGLRQQLQSQSGRTIP